MTIQINKLLFWLRDKIKLPKGIKILEKILRRLDHNSEEHPWKKSLAAMNWPNDLEVWAFRWQKTCLPAKAFTRIL
jgi:hypothetical protein